MIGGVAGSQLGMILAIHKTKKLRFWVIQITSFITLACIFFTQYVYMILQVAGEWLVQNRFVPHEDALPRIDVPTIIATTVIIQILTFLLCAPEPKTKTQ